MSMPKLSSDSAKGYVYIIVAIAAIVVVFILLKNAGGAINSILEALGLKDDPEEAALKNAIKDATGNTSDPGSPWSPKYYKNVPSGSRLVTNAAARDISKQIWDSVGTLSNRSLFKDYPEKGLAAIKQLPTQAALSYVVEVFNTVYHEDLFNYFKTHYDTDEQKDIFVQIINYVNHLPKF